MANLRKRSQNSTDSVKPEVKKRKPSAVRRSVRIKNDEKDPSNASKKDNQKRNKKKVPQKSRRKKLNEDDTDNTDNEAMYPQVINISLRNVLEESEKTPQKELLEEAGVVFECRECKSFFRVFTMFLKHKQCYCPTLTDRQSYSASNWNDFLRKEFFDLFQSSDDSDDSSGGNSDDDSAFEDGPSSSPKASDND